MDSDSSEEWYSLKPKRLKVWYSPNPERLSTLSSGVKFSGGNTLLHRLVLDRSDPNQSGSGNYVNALLLSMSDVPASVVNALNDDGCSALHLAVSKNDLTMVEKLLSSLVHIDVDVRRGRADRNTALHLAVESGYSSIVQELLNKGAAIDIQNRAEDTALQLALKLRALDIVKILVGANVNLHSRWTDPLHEAVAYDSLEAVEFLIDRGADVDGTDVFGRTPLHIAANRGNEDIAKLLVGKGADVLATDGDGRTPVDYAAESGNSEFFDFYQIFE